MTNNLFTKSIVVPESDYNFFFFSSLESLFKNFIRVHTSLEI